MPEEVKREENSVENLLVQHKYLTKEEIKELKGLSLDDLEVSEELKEILNQALNQTLIQPLSQKIDESRCTALSNITALALTLSRLTDESKTNLGKQLMVFAAKEEYPSAYCNLGDFYYKQEQNDAEAYKYYKKACESAQFYFENLPNGTLKKKIESRQTLFSQKLQTIENEIIDKVRSHDILPDNVRNRDELLPDKLLELAKFYKEIGAMKIVLTCYKEFLDQAMAYIKTTFARAVNINTPLNKMALYFTDCPENPMNLAPMNLANELAEFYKDGVDGVVEKKEKKAVKYYLRYVLFEYYSHKKEFDSNKEKMEELKQEKSFKNLILLVVSIEDKTISDLLYELTLFYNHSYNRCEYEHSIGKVILDKVKEFAQKERNGIKLFELGNYYYEYLCFGKQECLDCYQQASDMGNLDATLRVAQIYEGRHDGANALKYYKKASDMGNLDATLKVAQIYETGADGVKKDMKKALKYYEKASDMGNPNVTPEVVQATPEVAQVTLKVVQATLKVAQFYENGEGVEKNMSEAFKYYKKASDMGNPNVTPEVVQATPEVAQVTLKVAQATLKVAEIYEKGSDSVKINMKKALEYYEKAFNMGNSDATLRLAQIYENGEGVEKNMSKALKYYKKASKYGNLDATLRLAQIYEEGGDNCLGKIDMSEVFKYYKKASDMGNPNVTPEVVQATLKVAQIYESGEGVDKNMSEAFKYYKKASDMGNTNVTPEVAQATLRVAQIYESGEGVDKNMSEAFKYYKKASDMGNPNITPEVAQATLRLAQIYETGADGVAKNKRKAIEYRMKLLETSFGDESVNCALKLLNPKSTCEKLIMMAEIFSHRPNAMLYSSEDGSLIASLEKLIKTLRECEDELGLCAKTLEDSEFGEPKQEGQNSMAAAALSSIVELNDPDNPSELTRIGSRINDPFKQPSSKMGVRRRNLRSEQLSRGDNSSELTIIGSAIDSSESDSSEQDDDSFEQAIIGSAIDYSSESDSSEQDDDSFKQRIIESKIDYLPSELTRIGSRIDDPFEPSSTMGVRRRNLRSKQDDDSSVSNSSEPTIIEFSSKKQTKERLSLRNNPSKQARMG